MLTEPCCGTGFQFLEPKYFPTEKEGFSSKESEFSTQLPFLSPKLCFNMIR